MRVMLTVGDDTHTLAEWSRITNIPTNIISYRMKKGYSPKECINVLSLKNGRVDILKNLKRNCPECGKALNYSHKSGYTKAKERNSKCLPCKNIEIGKKRAGVNHPLYGKKLPETWCKNMSIAKKGKSNKSPTKFTKESMTGKLNPMYGKSVYTVWLEKYGKEIAEQKLIKMKERLSEKSKGVNNPMYGKPSPPGSGNGWKGWYNEQFFRSLRELSFMLEMDEKGNKWKSAETKQYSISYKDWNGVNRTYRPDFIIDEKTMVEIKPTRLMDSAKVKAKTKAARSFCKKHGLVYKLIDIKIKDYQILKEMVEEGKVTFTDKYKEKFANWKG